MAVPDWVSYVTLGTSVLTVFGGAAGGALITRRATRLEGTRTWERDQVTDRCLNLIRTLHELDAVVTTTVHPALQESPVTAVSTAAAWDAVRKAHHALQLATVEALVVARPNFMALAIASLRINPAVLVPHSRPQGIPVAAGERMRREVSFCQQLESQLSLALRADLGLLKQTRSNERSSASRSTTSSTPARQNRGR